MNQQAILSWLKALAAAASLAVIAACGGAVGSGGTGAASYSVGTVTGFGSIIVDGTPFDDRDAPVQSEDAPGQRVLAQARMGHRVEVEFEVDGVARSVSIEAELKGVVGQLDANGFRMLGQTVVINTDPAAGPVTQFGDGYTSLADVRVGHNVEVHGAPKLVAGNVVIQATRVDRRLLPYLFLRVAGTVAGLGTAGSTSSFTLGGLAVEFGGATLLPAGRSIANGQRVVVLARPSQLAIGARGPRLTADLVRIKERVNGSAESYLGGVVSGLDRTASSFSLAGVTVRYAGAEITPAGGALAEGQYVQVRGSFAGDGSLVATRLRIRALDGLPEAELKGTVSGFVPATGRLTVRDVPVDSTGAQLQNCPVGGLVDGLFVEIKGSLTATGVLAQRIECKSEPEGGIVERKGLAGNVNLDARTFTLTPASGAPQLVRWTANTFFSDITPQTLSGVAVEVEGPIVAGVLVALKVKPDD
jgi:hypothetical protein